MKKAIALFASLAMFSAASAQTVSCGKKINSGIDTNFVEYLNLIENFKAELGSIIFQHILDSRSEMIRLIQNSSDVEQEFFTVENIKEYGHTNDPDVDPPVPLKTTDKENVLNSLNTFFNVKGLIDEIEALAKTTDKYNVIIVKNQILNGISFDIDTFNLNYSSNIDSEAFEIFAASAMIDLNVNYRYLDYDNVLRNNTSKTNIILTMTNDSLLQNGIKNLQDSVGQDLIQSDDEFAWLKASDINYDNNNLFKTFEIYNEKKRSNYLKNLYSKEKFENHLTEFVKSQDYFSNSTSVANDIQMILPKSSTIIDETTNIIKPISAISNPKKYETEIRNQFFEKYEPNSKKNFTSGEKNISSEVFDLIEGKFEKNYTDFQTNLGETLDYYLGNNLNKNNIYSGKLYLEGVSIYFKNLNFDIPIQNLALDFVFRLNDEEITKDNLKSLTSSSLGEAVYSNIVAGIKSFQATFGTNDSLITNYDSYLKTETVAPLKFSGSSTSIENNVNIWDGIPNRIQDKDSLSALNDALSLNQASLSSLRFDLLNQGYQADFKLKYITMLSGGEISDYLIDPITNKVYLPRTFMKDPGDNYILRGTSMHIDYMQPKEQPWRSSGFNIAFSLLDLAISFYEFNSKTDSKNTEAVKNGSIQFKIIVKTQ